MGNEKAFIAGFDIKEIASMQKAIQASRVTMRIKRLMLRVETSRKPVIAAVRGSCFGGGLELILACHLRVATIGAKIGLPEINLATIPSFGGTVRLPKVIGRSRALELILTGKIISGEEAFRIGLVNKVCTDEELFPVVKSLGQTIAEKGALAVEAAIQSTVVATEISTEHAMRLESKLSGSLIETKDLKESIVAYFEKRKAVLNNS
jgi:enoyl-CoA hydratase/carnithine racemase